MPLPWVCLVRWLWSSWASIIFTCKPFVLFDSCRFILLSIFVYCLSSFFIHFINLLQVGLRSLNMGICPKLNALHVEAPQMVSLELKGCGVLSEAFIYCPLLTSLDASFCRWFELVLFYLFIYRIWSIQQCLNFTSNIDLSSQLKDDFLSATASSCPLTESLVLMSCPSVGPDGLSSLDRLPNLTYLDLSYTFLVNLQPVFDSCLYLKVLLLHPFMTSLIFIRRITNLHGFYFEGFGFALSSNS